MKKYYTVKEIAERYSLAEITIRQWLAAGKLKSIKIGRSRRIPVEEIEKLDQNQGVIK